MLEKVRLSNMYYHTVFIAMKCSSQWLKSCSWRYGGLSNTSVSHAIATSGTDTVEVCNL